MHISRFLWLVSWSLRFQRTSARLEAALLLPHGDFAWDADLVWQQQQHQQGNRTQEYKAAQEIARAARQAGRWLAHDVQPDLILLSTPHGVSLSRDFGIFVGADLASGTAPIGQDLRQHNNTNRVGYDVSISNVPVSSSMSQELLKYLTTNHGNDGDGVNNNVTGLYLSPDPTVPLPLFWGEVIPLLLIPSNPKRQAVLWSHSQRRHHQAGTNMVEELLTLGSQISTWMDTQKQKWAVVISGDLSHTHRADGPYGYSPDAAGYDQAVQDWAQEDPCQAADALLNRAKRLQPQALSCAFTGLVLLQGILCGNSPHASPTQGQHKSAWKSSVRANQNVTYYGMMAAKFWRSSNEMTKVLA